MGASHTYKIRNDRELEEFFHKKTREDYIMEEFISGDIYTFDGLADRDGNAIFYTSHHYGQSVMEAVNADNHVYFYSLRELPKDLVETGKKVLKEFNIKEKFFHFEFFRTPEDNKLVALEVNIRPPGGYTTDMFNYACDIDVYREWANIVVSNEFKTDYRRKYHCSYVSRKYNKNYKHSIEEVVTKYHSHIPFHTEMPRIFAGAMGDYAFLIRAEETEKILEMVRFIQG